MSIVIVAAALIAILIVFAAIRRKQNYAKRRAKIEAMRCKYKKALADYDETLALKLGTEYYTEIGRGKITDVDRKRVDYAISVMRLEQQSKAIVE